MKKRIIIQQINKYAWQIADSLIQSDLQASETHTGATWGSVSRSRTL